MRRPVRHRDLTVLELTGDDDAFTYGGGVVFRKGERVFWQFWDAPTTKTYVVWTARIDRNVFRQFPSACRRELGRALNVEPDALRTMSGSSWVGDRRRMLEVIADLEGRSHICPAGPEEMTRWELGERWGQLFQVDSRTIARFDAEDYMVRAFEEGMACGQVEGRFVGVYEDLEGCLAAIAEDMEMSGDRSNVFLEGDEGEFEKLDWNRGKWLGRTPKRLRIGFASATWRFRMRPFAREVTKKERKLRRGDRAKKRAVRGTIRKTRT